MASSLIGAESESVSLPAIVVEKLKGAAPAKITDAGLEHLKALTQLENLDLRKTPVTDAGVAELQKLLPNCKIVR